MKKKKLSQKQKAINRIQKRLKTREAKGEAIKINPTKENIKEILKETLNVEIDEDEIGYIALHIHSAIDDYRKRSGINLGAQGSACDFCCGKCSDNKKD